MTRQRSRDRAGARFSSRLLRAGALVAGVGAAGIAALAVGVDRYGQAEHAAPAPVIVVLGARVLPDGTASNALRARVEKAVALHRAGIAPRLLFSGGRGTYGPEEAVVARDLAVALGVDARACSVETQSHSTAENARFSARWLRAQGVDEVVLVSEPYHLLRAGRLFGREGIRIHPSPALRSDRNLHWADRAYWTAREAMAIATRPSLW